MQKLSGKGLLEPTKRSKGADFTLARPLLKI